MRFLIISMFVLEDGNGKDPLTAINPPNLVSTNTGRAGPLKS